MRVLSGIRTNYDPQTVIEFDQFERLGAINQKNILLKYIGGTARRLKVNDLLLRRELNGILIFLDASTYIFFFFRHKVRVLSKR